MTPNKFERCKLAEEVGFEPTVRFSPHTRFPSVPLKPLGHSSAKGTCIEILRAGRIPLYRYLAFKDTMPAMTRIRFFLGLFSLLSLSCCAAHQQTILVSIPPFKYYVQSLMGGAVPVESVVPAGANPHIFDPSARQLARFSDAVIWFKIGETFERKVAGALRHANSNLKEINLLDGLDLIQSSDCPHCAQHAADLHVWLSARLGQQIAKKIAQALEIQFPTYQQQIRNNLGQLIAMLDALDQRLAAQLANHQGEAILVSHGAFAYFCRDYGLRQLTVEKAGKEPSARQLTEVIAEARATRTDVAILQVQFNNKGTELVAKELGLRTCTIDPLYEEIPTTLTQLADCIAP